MTEAEEKAARVAKRLTLLPGEKIHLAEGHFTQRIATTLNRFIQDLGAEPTADRLEANIVLQNPVSEASKSERQKVAALLRANPGLSQIHVPYVWLSLCHNGLARAEISNPLLKSPFFVKNGQPLQVWVSLNVHKDLPGETPYQARQTLWDALAAGGALITEKRAHADILVVDYNTKFWLTIKEEMDTHRREQEQKAVERDWVNDCVAQRKVNWMSGKTSEKDKREEKEDSGEESFGEEDMPEKRGPGKPVGPRKDYTPSEDDFMARWLAFHSPHGSWGSRKTYKTMFDQSERYPVAAQHSSQSWHERFRKQQNTLKKRIAFFTSAGIDDSLMTKDEREKEAVKKAAAAATSTGGANEGNAAGPSSTATDPARPASKPQAKSKSNGKRALVGSDSDSDQEDAAAIAPVQSRMKRTAEAVSTEKAPGSNAMDIDPPAPSQTQPAAPAPPAPSQAAAPAAPSLSHSAAPAPPAPSQAPTLAPLISSQPEVAAPTAGPSRSQPLQGDSITVDQSLNPEPEQESVEEARPSQPAGVPPAESQQSNTSDGPEDLLAGLETQAIMSDFARLQAVALAGRQAVQPSTAIQAVVETIREEVIQPAPAAEAIRAETSTQARVPSIPRSPQPAADHPPPAKRPRHTEPVNQRASPRSEMPAPSTAARAPRISQANDGSGRQRISVPVRVNFNVVGVTQDGSTEEEGEEEYRPKRTPRASLKRDGGTPSLHRDLLQNNIGSSVSGSARRQSRHSHGSSRRQQSPDTVYASPAVPPAVPRTPSITSPSVAPRTSNSNNSRRRASPTQTQKELEAAILGGQQVARRHAEEYKERIQRLSTRYNASPLEVYKALDSTKAPGEVKLPWDEIERRLDVYYQYAG